MAAKTYFGKVCAKHPELKGERVLNNRVCIGCELERLHTYYEKNKEKVAERQRAYREENKEKIAERQRKYREKNKEKNAERRRKYREENKEKIAERQRKYEEDMPAEQREIRLAKRRADNYERKYNA